MFGCVKHLPHVTTEETVSTAVAVPSTGSVVAACAGQGVRLVGRKLYKPITSHIFWLNESDEPLKHEWRRSFRMQIRASLVQTCRQIVRRRHRTHHWALIVRIWTEDEALEELPTLPTRYYNPPTLPVFPLFHDRRDTVKSILVSNMDHPDDPLRSL